MEDLTKDASQMVLREFNKIPFSYIATILVASWALTFIVRWLLPFIADRLPPRFRYLLLPAVPIFKLVVILVAIILITPLVINPSMQNLIVILGTAGLALGFAFKDFVSSIIAGIIALYEQPYRVSDRVTINGIYGEVKSINLRSLKLVTPDDTAVTIPHNCIWNGSIQNSNDGCREQLCIAEFYLQPGENSAQIRRLLRDVALTSPYTLFRRAPRVSVRLFPWGTRYSVKAYPVDGRDELSYITDLTIRGKAALKLAGAQLTQAIIPPTPQDSA